MYRLDSGKENAIYDWVYSVLGSAGVNDSQLVEFSEVPTGGTWTITVLNADLMEEETSNLAYNANAAAIKAALEVLTYITTVTVAGNYTTGFTITVTSPAKTFLHNFIITSDLTGAGGDVTASASKLAEGSADVSVIWVEPKQEQLQGDRPEKPFVTLNIVSPPALEGQPGKTYKELDTFTWHFKKTFMLSVNVYADNKHMEYIQNLINSSYLLQSMETLQAEDLELRTHGTVQDLSALIPNGWERRAQVDFNFAYGEDVDETIGEIHIVNVEGTFTSDKGTDITEEITIDSES